MTSTTTNNPLLIFLQTHLPAFQSPPRLSSLYSSFTPLRTLNPDGYAANSTTWLSALILLSRHGLLPSTSTGSAPSALLLSSTPALAQALSTPQLGQPLSLSAVINDAVAQGALIPLHDFNARERSIYAPGPWVPSPMQVVRWGLKQLGLTGGGGDALVAGDFVVRETLEKVGEMVSREVLGLGGVTERVIPRREFEERFSGLLKEREEGAELSVRDMGVLLRFLERDRGVLSFSERTVKVAGPGGKEDVTREDESIANMRDLIQNLGEQVEVLTERVGQLEKEARAAVKEGQNVKAKRALRSKKAAEGMLEERGKMLETLERTWQAIEAASDNVAIVQAMKEGKDVLRGLNEKVGGAEGVEDVMQGLREQMDVAEDVTSVINEGAAAGIDEGEVDNELEALEKEEREKNAAQEKAQRQASEAKEQAEQAAKEKAEQEQLRKRLEGIDVPMTEPIQQEHEDGEDKFEEANEMVQ
ncbi:Snf7-like protein 2 [Elsinoe fawcettii]|nr:Snf7-like protein 2 [Elsinoe fawcettii]